MHWYTHFHGFTLRLTRNTHVASHCLAEIQGSRDPGSQNQRKLIKTLCGYLYITAHLHQGIISRTWTIRSRLPKASDGTIHERGKLVLQVLVTSRNKNRNSVKYGNILFFTLVLLKFCSFFVSLCSDPSQATKAVLLQGTCLEVFHQDIAGLQQALHNLLTSQQKKNRTGRTEKASPGSRWFKPQGIGLTLWYGRNLKVVQALKRGSSWLAPVPRVWYSSESQSSCCGSALQSKMTLVPGHVGHVRSYCLTSFLVFRKVVLDLHP